MQITVWEIHANSIWILVSLELLVLLSTPSPKNSQMQLLWNTSYAWFGWKQSVCILIFLERKHPEGCYNSCYRIWLLLNSCIWWLLKSFQAFLCVWGGGGGGTLCGMRILVLQPGVEPMSPTVEAWSLNHWTTMEVLKPFQFLVRFLWSTNWEAGH